MAKRKQEPVATQPEPDTVPETDEIRTAPEIDLADTEKTSTDTVSKSDEIPFADPEPVAVQPKVIDVEESALDPEPEIEAALTWGQCPKCRHQSDPHSPNVKKIGHPNRLSYRGVFNGVEYSLIESQRILCEKCGQIHFVKTYK